MPAISADQPLYGPEGEQYNYHQYQRYPLGHKLILADGRVYRYCRVGAVAAVAGKLYQSEVPGANFDTLAVATSGVVGDRSIAITNGATAITADMFAEGFAVTEAAAGAGEGRLYKIAKSHDAIADTAAGSIPLAGGNGLQAAITAGADTITLMKSPYADLIVHPSPPTAMAVGVAAAPITATYYGWFQTWGPCATLIDGTVAIAQWVMASDAVDGAVEAFGLTEATPNTIKQIPCGIVMEVAPDTGYGSIFLTIGQ